MKFYDTITMHGKKAYRSFAEDASSNFQSAFP